MVTTGSFTKGQLRTDFSSQVMMGHMSYQSIAGRGRVRPVR